MYRIVGSSIPIRMQGDAESKANGHSLFEDEGGVIRTIRVSMKGVGREEAVIAVVPPSSAGIVGSGEEGDANRSVVDLAAVITPICEAFSSLFFANPPFAVEDASSQIGFDGDGSRKSDAEAHFLHSIPKAAIDPCSQFGVRYAEGPPGLREKPVVAILGQERLARVVGEVLVANSKGSLGRTIFRIDDEFAADHFGFQSPIVTAVDVPQGEPDAGVEEVMVLRISRLGRIVASELGTFGESDMGEEGARNFGIGKDIGGQRSPRKLNL